MRFRIDKCTLGKWNDKWYTIFLVSFTTRIKNFTIRTGCSTINIIHYLAFDFVSWQMNTQIHNVNSKTYNAEKKNYYTEKTVLSNQQKYFVSI